MPEPRPDFQTLQYEFTAHLRDPEHNAAPAGIEDRRLGVYRELLYNNVESFMASSFPVLRSLMDDAAWHVLVRRYFAEHEARTPLFPKLPQEFLHYLSETHGPIDGLPFAAELAHYEWLELETDLDKRSVEDEPVDADVDCLDGHPVLNPIARVHAYRYPVHRISPTFRPQVPDEQPTYLVVFRGTDDGVGFMALNPVTARLVELILHSPDSSGRALLEQIAAEMQHPDPSVVVAGGRDILTELTERGVVIGARAVPASPNLR